MRIIGEDLHTVRVCNLKPTFPSAAELDRREREKVLIIFTGQSENEEFQNF